MQHPSEPVVRSDDELIAYVQSTPAAEVDTADVARYWALNPPRRSSPVTFGWAQENPPPRKPLPAWFKAIPPIEPVEWPEQYDAVAAWLDDVMPGDAEIARTLAIEEVKGQTVSTTPEVRAEVERLRKYVRPPVAQKRPHVKPAVRLPRRREHREDLPRRTRCRTRCNPVRGPDDEEGEQPPPAPAATLFELVTLITPSLDGTPGARWHVLDALGLTERAWSSLAAQSREAWE